MSPLGSSPVVSREPADFSFLRPLKPTLLFTAFWRFVVPGPGALSGLRKCFADTGKLTDAGVIRLLQQRQQDCFTAVGVTFPALPGRELQLIDIQNLFCEVDKYARVAYPQFTPTDGRQCIKQRFQASAGMLPLWYPPKWGLNDRQDALLSAEVGCALSSDEQSPLDHDAARMTRQGLNRHAIHVKQHCR